MNPVLDAIRWSVGTAATSDQKLELLQQLIYRAIPAVIPFHNALCCIPAAGKEREDRIGVRFPAFFGDFGEESAIGDGD